MKEKFAAHPQVKRIARHRQIPKHIYNAKNELRTIREKTKRKYISLLKKKNYKYLNYIYFFSKYFYYIYLFYFRESNRRAHSKPGTVPFISERKRHVAQQEI